MEGNDRAKTEGLLLQGHRRNGRKPRQGSLARAVGAASVATVDDEALSGCPGSLSGRSFGTLAHSRPHSPFQ